MKPLRTSDLARAVGIHPNTVRLYVDWGLIPPVERNESGYRIFTQKHLDCLRLARTIYAARYPGRDLRALGNEIIQCAAADSFAEAGIPFEARSWFAIAAPAGTPRPVIDRIAADVKRVVEAPEYREKFINGMGLEPLSMGPDQFAEFLGKDRAKYAQRVKNANVRLD